MATVIGKSKADIAFAGKHAEALKARDFKGLESLYLQYGTYLELVEPLAVVPNTKEENIAFRQEWDRRVEQGQKKDSSS